MNRSDGGQGLVEYALILVLISIVVIGILLLLGPVIGGVFSNIVDGLDGGNTPALDASSTESPSFDTFEKIMDFWEETDDQEEGIAEARTLLIEAAYETLELAIEYAVDTGDEVFHEGLSNIQQLVEEGRFAEIPDLLEDPGELPVDVNSAVILRVEPLRLEVCGHLNGAVLSDESMIEAQQAVLEQEEEMPGSTGNAFELLDDIWSHVNQKNTMIEVTTFLIGCPSE